MPFGVVAAVASGVTAAATAVGIGAATAGVIAAVATPALTFAGVGALGAAITGGDPLKGAELGGLSGLGAGAGAAIGAGIGGVGSTIASIGGTLGGAAGGALGGAATGTNPLLGAALGGIGGYGYANSGAFSGAFNNGVPVGEISGDPNSLVGAGANGKSFVDPTTGQTVTIGGTGTGTISSPSVQTGADVASQAGPVAGQAAATAAKSGGLLGSLTASDLLKIGAGVVSAGAAGAAKPTAAQIPPAQTPESIYQTTGLNNAALNGANPTGRTALNPFPGGTQSTYGSTGASISSYGSPIGGVQQNPQSSPYWQYGGPEQQYYANNNLAEFGFARGGSTMFDTRYSDRHVQGPGTPTSDSIPAKLSRGEYVLDYKDVALLGGGSNNRGAKKLDIARRKLNSGDKRGALNVLAGAR